LEKFAAERLFAGAKSKSLPQALLATGSDRPPSSQQACKGPSCTTASPDSPPPASRIGLRQRQANQWPTHTHPIDPHNDGVYFPEARKENLVNTMMETYLQDPPSSCMSCHQVFNALGRDFVAMLASFR